MAEIIMLHTFNEPLTTRFDAEDNPVQRALDEMTADEVVAAAQWLMSAFERLDRVDPTKAEDAMVRHLDLMNLLYVAMPQWQWQRTTSLCDVREALRRYWHVS